jgi:hypothetical protein
VTAGLSHPFVIQQFISTEENEMNWLLDAHQWAERVFGGSNLGDPRRTRRLVDYAARQAQAGNASPMAACRGDAAAAEGAYRLIRNQKVDAGEIAEGGFQATASMAAEYPGVLLALEDTTSLSYKHKVREELGTVGSKANSKARGMQAHSVVLVGEERHETLGLIEQERWLRDPKKRGIRHQRRTRPYKEKESFKWQRASEHMSERLGETMARVISVCDREADIFEYLQYKREHSQRYVVRACRDRSLNSTTKHLWDALGACPVSHYRVVDVPQSGGRAARQATMSVRAKRVALKRRPETGSSLSSVEFTVVYALEARPPRGVEPLEWMLLTSETVEQPEDADRILEIYERRWEVEEFHKAWKSGVGVENRRMETAENIERVAVILAFIAMRLLQIRQRVTLQPDDKCTEVLRPIEWQCLWSSVERSKLPEHPPTVRWAYYGIARMGGWIDTKGTGRVGWQTMWLGWQRLEERVDAVAAIQQHAGATNL